MVYTTVMPSTDNGVAATILAQLGGQRFKAMTGAKSFAGDDKSLSFRLPGDPGFVKNNIRAVRITLTPADLYKVEFFALRKDADSGLRLPKVIETADDVYVDSLREVFTRATGLDTSL